MFADAPSAVRALDAAPTRRASVIFNRISSQVRSQEISASRPSTARSHSACGLPRARANASAKAGGPSAMSTGPASPQSRTTSRTGVDTTGKPAARNSGVLVGLMKRVLSLRAKGMKPASQPDR